MYNLKFQNTVVFVNAPGNVFPEQNGMKQTTWYCSYILHFTNSISREKAYRPYDKTIMWITRYICDTEKIKEGRDGV